MTIKILHNVSALRHKLYQTLKKTYRYLIRPVITV